MMKRFPYPKGTRTLKTTLKRHRKAAMLGSAGVALLMAVPLAGPAMADPNPVGIDSTRPGHLVITKLEKNGWTKGEGTGQQLSSTDLSGSKAIEGVEFTICLAAGYGGASLADVSYDITNPAWWTTAHTIVENAQSDLYDFFLHGSFLSLGLNTTTYPPNPNNPLCQRATTDSAGQVDLSGLPLGLYYIRESKTPPNVDPGPAFFITLPLTDPVTEGNWLYDVYAYPKDSMNNTHKYVNDSTAVSVGSTVKYTITMAIPQSVTNGFIMLDPVPTTLSISQATSNVTLDVINPSDDSANRQTMAAATISSANQISACTWGTMPTTPPAGVDCYLSITSETPPGYSATAPTIASGSNNTLRLEFTTEGLNKLGEIVNPVGENLPLAEIRVTFDATVTPSMITKCKDGAAWCDTVDVVVNQAYFYPNQYSYTDAPYSPSLTEAVETHFGGVNLHKLDQDGNPLYGGFGTCDADWTDPTAPLVASNCPGTFANGTSAVPGAAKFMLFPDKATAAAWDGTTTDPDAISAIAVKDGLLVYDAASDDPTQWQNTNVFTTDAEGSTAMLGLAVKTSVKSGELNVPGLGATCGFRDPSNSSTLVYTGGTGAQELNLTVASATSFLPGTLYWGLEIKAPQGYELQPAPFPVCVASYLDGDNAGTSYDDVNVVNVEADGAFELPLTGWNGVQTTIAGFGFAFIALAVAYAIKQRRNVTKVNHI